MTASIRLPNGTVAPLALQSGWLGVERLLDTKQVADILDCGPWRVGELRRTKRLRAVMIGRSYRYDPADVRAFINASKVAA